MSFVFVSSGVLLLLFFFMSPLVFDVLLFFFCLMAFEVSAHPAPGRHPGRPLHPQRGSNCKDLDSRGSRQADSEAEGQGERKQGPGQ